MKLCFILLIFILFPVVTTFSQQFTNEQIDELIASSSEAELVEINTLLSFEGSFHQASKVASKLLEFQPNSANYNYRKGFALINSSTDFNKSKEYLEKAVTEISKNYDLLSAEDTGAPVDALFYMGKSYHLNNDIEKAKEFYKSFLDRAKKKALLVPEAELRLQQCDVAKIMLNDEKDYIVDNLGPLVNSELPDYSPVISLDGYAIYFTSRRLRKDSSNLGIVEPGTAVYLEDVYVSHKDNNGYWTEPELLEFCKPDKNEATVAVSTDERRIYVYKGETGNGDIFFSDFEASKFKELEYLEDNGVNTKYWEPHINVTPDGQQKYFVSDRKGGYGGRDIYVINKLPNGKWSEPKNVGPEINTPYDEDAPFLAVDNKTMYFASNGPASMGGFDIFMTSRDEVNGWSRPVNLGYPLNTTSDDLYYTTTVDGFTGYLTSFREDGIGEKDIYVIKNDYLGVDNISVLLGEIESADGEPIPEDLAFTLKCLDCENWYDIEFFPRISDGTFIASLRPCHSYELILHHKTGEEEIHRETIKTTCDFTYEEIYRHIMLDVPSMTLVTPKEIISSFEPLSMKHFFDYNNNELNPRKGALSTFLDSVQMQMERGRKNISLEINSSASKVPTRTFESNEILAQTRAQELKDLLDEYYSEEGISDSITILIKEVKVSGPDYQRDYKDILKYLPYQYVSVNLDGINSVSDDMITFKSKDEELNVGTPASQLSEQTAIPDKNGDVLSSGSMIESNYTYHVIVGVFRRIDNANGLVKNLKQKGYESEIIGKRNGLHVVSVGSSDSFNEIKPLLQKARQEVIESAWILNSKK